MHLSEGGSNYSAFIFLERRKRRGKKKGREGRKEREKEKSPLNPSSPMRIITHTHSCTYSTLLGSLANIHTLNSHNLKTPTYTIYKHWALFLALRLFCPKTTSEVESYINKDFARGCFYVLVCLNLNPLNVQFAMFSIASLLPVRIGEKSCSQSEKPLDTPAPAFMLGFRKC